MCRCLVLFNQSEYFSSIPLNLVCCVFVLLQFKILLLPCFSWDFFTHGLLGPDKHGRAYTHLQGFLCSSLRMAAPVSLDSVLCLPRSPARLCLGYPSLCYELETLPHLREVLGWRRHNSAGHCTSLTFSTSEAKQRPQKLSSLLPNPLQESWLYLLNLCAFVVSYFWTLICIA